MGVRLRSRVGGLLMRHGDISNGVRLRGGIQGEARNVELRRSGDWTRRLNAEYGRHHFR